MIIVRKLGVPEQPELGMGAIGEDGVRVLNQRVIRLARVTTDELADVEEAERSVLTGRARLLRGDRPAEQLAGHTVVIVDDFTPTSDDEVRELLTRAAADRASAAAPAEAQRAGGLPGRDEEVVMRVGDLTLAGHLTVPPDTSGLVLFAHGSGSSRHSPRNQYVALILNQAGLGTLLFDLLTPSEAAERANVFDIELLGERLAGVSAWAHDQPWGRDLSIGWFGASTGAGAALWAAAELHAGVAAIVSRGGRPDLAGPRLPAVTAPTLLIVGALDTQVLALNRAAQAQLRCSSDLVVVPGATHLFEEPGTLTAAARHAQAWFTTHLRRVAHAGRPPG